MIRKIHFIGLSALLVASAAQAATKVSLVTISPGTILFDSFGHSAVLVENTESTANPTVYEYGALNLNAVLMSRDPTAAITDLLNSHSKTRASKLSVTMMTLPNGNRYPWIYKYRYLIGAEANREVTISPLDLTEDQAKSFVSLIEKDIASGEYNYNNYTNNCATRIRDRLFDDSVLGATARATLDSTVNKSISALVMESFDDAVAASTATPKKLSLVPSAMKRFPAIRSALSMLSMAGLREEYTSSSQFRSSIVQADTMLQMAASDPEGGSEMQSLATGFHNYFLAPELEASPISQSQEMFLPKKLHDGLTQVVNPATGHTVIDSSREMHRTSAEERSAPAYNPTLVRPTGPVYGRGAGAGNSSIATPAAAPAPAPAPAPVQAPVPVPAPAPAPVQPPVPAPEANSAPVPAVVNN